VQEEIERFDAARTLRAYFNVEREDARLYHVVLQRVVPLARRAVQLIAAS
jgi:hypothetical protein